MDAPSTRPGDTRPAPQRHAAARPRESVRLLSRDQWPVIVAVAAGGMVGAVARYGALLLWPAPPGAIPWSTFGVNVLGCALMGVLMALVTGIGTPHHLVRPFFGTGVLGGFTTFSTYAVDVHALAGEGAAGAGVLYLAVTLLSALAATGCAMTVTQALLRRAPAAAAVVRRKR